MAMEIGDARKGTGLAGAIAKAMIDLQPTIDLKKKDSDVLPNAIATAVVEYIQSDAEVEVDGLGMPTGNIL